MRRMYRIFFKPNFECLLHDVDCELSSLCLSLLIDDSDVLSRKLSYHNVLPHILMNLHKSNHESLNNIVVIDP